MSKKIVYRVIFQAGQQIYDLYSYSVSESEMFGFIEISDLAFNTENPLLIDPNLEKLKTEFAHVKRTYIPLHNIIRIDCLEKEGIAKIYPVSDQNNIRVLSPGFIRRTESSGTKDSE